MIDPLTAFGAAANSLQFAEVGIKLVNKTIEYSTGGGSQEHQALQDVVQRLMVSNDHLQTLMDREREKLESEAEKLGPEVDGVNIDAEQLLPPGPSRALYRANEACLRVSKEFFGFLNKLKLNRYGTFWRSVKLALIAVKKTKELELMTQRIQEARANLMLCLMIFLAEQTTRHRKESETNYETIIEEAQNVIEHSSELKTDIASLTSKLSEFGIDDANYKKEFRSILRGKGDSLKDLSQTVSEILEQRNSELSAVLSQLKHLLPSMDRELVARRLIVKSLYFVKMNDRRDRVQRAHNGTYQWIFKPKGDNVKTVVWDDFLHWLSEQDDKPIYWIFGKPGCGKTTMMRELDERLSKEAGSRTWSFLQDDWVRSALRKWVGEGDLLQGSCYFWYAGTAEQKSLTGLLQSLVYQLLQQRPDLIDKVVPVNRWEDALCSVPMQHWEERDLVTVLDGIIEHTQADDKISLFIDGLDEYDGPDWQREKFLCVLSRLTRASHVKACVASRPWNIFRDAFEKCPQLCLEDLTKGDISAYIHEKLGENSLFQKQQRQDPQLLGKLSGEITSKARGVFLWVYLVVRDLLRVLRDGGRSNHLFRELERTPPDLDNYFKRMMETIEESYRKDAGMILQAALCNMDHERDNTQDLASGPDLHLFHLDYVDECMDPCFAAKPQVCDVLNEKDAEAVDEILESLHRRLASRCMGLLECEMSSSWGMFLRPSADLWLTRIEFLHRTVRDFLLKPSAQCLLREYTGESFDAHLFRCNLLIVNVVSSIMKADVDGRYASISCFLRHIKSRPIGEEASFLLFERLVDLLGKQALEFKSWLTSRHCYQRNFVALAEFILHWNEETNPAMKLAIKLGWKSYIESRSVRQCIQQKQGQSLPEYGPDCCQEINSNACTGKRTREEANPDGENNEQQPETPPSKKGSRLSARQYPESSWEELKYVESIDNMILDRFGT